MDRQPPVTVPDSLRYCDGLYKMERFARAGAATSIREKRIFTRALRAIHRPWFAVWMPANFAALTTIGRKSGKPRMTFVRAYRDTHKGYLVPLRASTPCG